MAVRQLRGLLPLRPPPLLLPGMDEAWAQAERTAWHLEVMAQPVSHPPGWRALGPGGWEGLALARAETELAPLTGPDGSGLDGPLGVTGDGGELLAVLTAGDLRTGRHPELAQLVWEALPAPDLVLLHRLSALVRLRGGRLALVGGAVRDALLGRPLSQVPDLDLVVVGAGVLAVAQASGLPYTHHPVYDNATLQLPGERSLDLVAARIERYPVVGGPPQPHPGTLWQDLARRDFTLNSLAVVVGEPGLHWAGDALSDLHARRLCPLHHQTLPEDASRLVRAARLAARLGLDASAELLAQVPAALAVAAQTPRLDAELRLALNEPRPAEVARVLVRWGAGSLWPAHSLPLLDALDALRAEGQPVPASVYAAALLHGAPDPAALAARLGLGEKPGRLLERALGDVPAPPATPEGLLRRLLLPAPDYEPVSARDLLGSGLAAGPLLGRAVKHLAALRRQGRLHSRDEEWAELRAQGWLPGDQPAPGPGEGGGPPSSDR